MSPREYRIVVHYDHRIIRTALNNYFMRRLGRTTFWAVGGVAMLASIQVVVAGWNPVSMLLIGCLAIIMGVMGWGYLLRLRQSETFLSKMSEPTVTFAFTDEGLRTQSELGASLLKWETFDEVLCFRSVWLLVYAKSGYLTLPTETLTAEVRDLIRSKLRREGLD